MKPLLADAVYFLAMLNPADQYHEQAMSFHRTGTEPLLTTEYVLVEVGDGLCSQSLRQRFNRFVDVLRSGADVQIVPAGTGWFNKGCAFYASRADKDWSLTDCISFLVMSDHGLIQALTADHHFEQAGFTALMKMAQAG